MQPKIRHEPVSFWLACSFLLIALFALAPRAATAEEKPFAPASIPGAVIVTAEEVVEMILTRKDLVIVDSRKKSEYAKGHIEGAFNLINTSMQEEDLVALSPNKAAPLIFYCNGDRCLRSSDAVHKALQWGYHNLFWFRGGWKEWTDKRLPVVAD